GEHFFGRRVDNEVHSDVERVAVAGDRNDDVLGVGHLGVCRHWNGTEPYGNQQASETGMHRTLLNPFIPQEAKRIEGSRCPAALDVVRSRTYRHEAQRPQWTKRCQSAASRLLIEIVEIPIEPAPSRTDRDRWPCAAERRTAVRAAAGGRRIPAQQKRHEQS